MGFEIELSPEVLDWEAGEFALTLPNRPALGAFAEELSKLGLCFHREGLKLRIRLDPVLLQLRPETAALWSARDADERLTVWMQHVRLPSLAAASISKHGKLGGYTPRVELSAALMDEDQSPRLEADPEASLSGQLAGFALRAIRVEIKDGWLRIGAIR
jgi:hypothetical protein